MANPPETGQSPSQTSVPVCYRHPGRQTYVSCVRCGRPACPDCLRPAAVGHQCVDCIRQGNQGVRRAAGRFGGTVTAGAARVTMTLIGLNVLLYIVLLAKPGLADDWAIYGGGVATGQWYRLFTAAFLPPTGGLGIIDIAFNMWALYIVGPAVERMLGPARYLTVYLVSALGGNVLYYLITKPDQGALGASGAIFGLFGAWFVLARRLRMDARPVVMLIVLNLVISFVGANYIAWQAHVGGLVAGGLLTAAFAYAPRKNRTAIQVAATVAILVVMGLIVVVRNHQLLGTYGFYGGRFF
jgi:membrane associated rhomboid family serine protease